MSYKYKEEVYNNLNLIKELVKDYGTCPQCGSAAIGDSKKAGTMDYNGKVGTFERTCKCGWEVKIKVDKV
ncbi:DUF3797 domain-containing protein [Rummeliibacillus sp. JY-2-4R]